MMKDNVFMKSDKFLKDMIGNLLAARSDTISYGLAWTLWLITTHPVVETKILQEIKSTQSQVSREDGVFTFQDLNKLVYLHATINEALRLYPSVPFEHKVSIGPDILPSGHRIGKNTRMKEIWGEDCLEFKPYKLLAFNVGPRSCLGKYLAMVQMKVVASALIWNYCIRIVENHQVSPNFSMQLSMKHGLKVIFNKRNKI